MQLRFERTFNEAHTEDTLSSLIFANQSSCCGLLLSVWFSKNITKLKCNQYVHNVHNEISACWWPLQLLHIFSLVPYHWDDWSVCWERIWLGKQRQRPLTKIWILDATKKYDLLVKHLDLRCSYRKRILTIVWLLLTWAITFWFIT